VLYSLSLSLSFKQRTRRYKPVYGLAIYGSQKSLPVLIHTNCIVKEPTMNWWWFYSGSFMKTADSLKYSKPTTNQRVFFMLK